MVVLRLLFKIISSIFLIFGIFGYGKFLLGVRFYIPGNTTEFLVFLAGATVFTIIWFLYLGREDSFWSTLEHELTHALFATLFFKKINSISASRRRGGLITIEGGNAFIALSPYFFPLAPLIILFIGLLLPSEVQIYVIFLLGFFYQFHLLNLMRELHPGQPDLQLSGYVFLGLVVSFFNIFFLGIVLAFISAGSEAMIDFIWDGLKNSVYLMFDFWEYFLKFVRTM